TGEAALFGLRSSHGPGIRRTPLHDSADLRSAGAFGYTPAGGCPGPRGKSAVDISQSDAATLSARSNRRDRARFHPIAWGIHYSGSPWRGQVGNDRQSDTEPVRAVESAIRLRLIFDPDGC